MARPTLLIVVPARGGSKRLPGKHLRPLCGRNLLAHADTAIGEAALDAPVVLSTDDAAIAAEGRRLGWLVPFVRPRHLSGDDSASVDMLLHALDAFGRSAGYAPELVMLLQVTSPLRPAATLAEAVALLEARADADAVVGVRALERTPQTVFRLGADGFLAPAGADSAPLYTPNGALYVIRTEIVRRRRSLFPERTLPVVMDARASLDIDTELDWRMAEYLLAQPVTAAS
ncbi:MAG TPA: acylneuraminate cytidylyltransferase family protein [Alphaproteobacteria bacterium]